MQQRIRIAANYNRGDQVREQVISWSCGEIHKPEDGSYAISSVTLAASVKCPRFCEPFITSSAHRRNLSGGSWCHQHNITAPFSHTA